MKYLLFLLIGSTSFAIDTDKIAHGGVGLAVTLASYGILKKAGVNKTISSIIGLSTGIGLSIAKELNDKRFNKADLLAGSVGSLTGVGFIYLFEF